MPNKKYDHNVDIKSTQLASEIKNLSKNVFVGIGSIFLAGIGFLFVVAVINALIMTNRDREERKRTISITPLSTMRTIVNDYQNNEARYDIEWDNRYVTHIGKVTKINSGNFDISTQSPRLGKVICDWNADQKERVAKLNTGNTISVIGKLDVYKDYSYGYYNFKIKYCEIP